MQDTLERLTAIQALETRAIVVRRRLDSIPPEVQERQQGVLEQEAALDAVVADIRAAQVRLQSLENDIRDEQARIQKLEVAINMAKDASSIQHALHEKEGHRAAIGRAEDESIELLGRIEQGEASVLQLKSKIAELAHEFDAFRTTAEQDEAELRSDLNRLEEEMRGHEESVSVVTLKTFRELLECRKHRAVVPLRGESCGGCGMSIPKNEQVKVQAMHTLERCPSCQRILVTQAMFEPNRVEDSQAEEV